MARPLRIQYPDAVYHVMSRGNERREIVRDDADRQRRLDWLCRTVETYGWRLHAFVLMRNHDHLFVQTPQANLSAGMQFFNGSYTSYFNRRHRRVGKVGKETPLLTTAGLTPNPYTVQGPLAGRHGGGYRAARQGVSDLPARVDGEGRSVDDQEDVPGRNPRRGAMVDDIYR